MNRLLSFTSSFMSISTISKQSLLKMSSASFSKVSHVIFDMDGLLLDTEPIYEKVVADILKTFDKPYPKDVRYRVMGTTEDKSAEIVIDAMKIPMSKEDFIAKHKAMCKERFVKLSLLKGAEALLRHLHQHKVPMCIATSSSEESAYFKMKSHPELFELFSHKVTGLTDPEVIAGKPEPYIFLVAAKRFANPPDPSKCLVFEDSPNGVKAAKAAGMQSVMVPDENVAEELKKDASIVLDSLEDFKPELFGLPPFKRK